MEADQSGGGSWISEVTPLKAVIVEESVGDCQTSSATCHLVQPLILLSQVLFLSGLILSHLHQQQSQPVHLLLHGRNNQIFYLSKKHEYINSK